MIDQDRHALLRDLEEHAAYLKELAAAARESPDDPDRLLAVCDAVFEMREVLDELGVPHARSGNDEWGRITPWQTVTRLGLADEGQVRTFRTLSEGTSWVAIHELPPDHVLYVLGRGFPIADLRLDGLTDLRRYVLLPG